MAFTIEPGLYETGWGGMRIEDTVLLRDNTVEILTKSNAIYTDIIGKDNKNYDYVNQIWRNLN